MILLDTNVLIYASGPESPYYGWARATIIDAVTGDDAAVNAIVLAELCAAAAEVCAAAYGQFQDRRCADTGKSAPVTPRPEFFMGAHALIMGWKLATADAGRFRSHFPFVSLTMPQ